MNIDEATAAAPLSDFPPDPPSAIAPAAAMIAIIAITTSNSRREKPAREEVIAGGLVSCWRVEPLIGLQPGRLP